MDDDFLEYLNEQVAKRVDDLRHSPATEFVIYKPESMSDEEWEAWKEELREGFGEDPGSPDEDAPAPGAASWS